MPLPAVVDTLERETWGIWKAERARSQDSDSRLCASPELLFDFGQTTISHWIQFHHLLNTENRIVGSPRLGGIV